VVSGPTHCGIAAELQDGREALILADPSDAAAIAAAVRRIRAEPALGATMREAGAVFAAARSWDIMARRQEALYFEVCASRP
jgi:glycosyltransferase involved in cell wall biosynthesis